MTYPFKHPHLYGEAAMQGIERKELAAAIGITSYQLRNRQDPATDSDFDARQMAKASELLHKPVTELFNLSSDTRDSA